MYKLAGKRKLGRKASHRRALVQNQIRSLFASGYVSTTSQKAKVLKANASSLISKVKTKKDQLSLQRELMTVLGSSEIVKKTHEYCKSVGAGVSIVKIGFRAGDNAEVSKVILQGFAGKTKKAATVTKANDDSKKNDKPVKSSSTTANKGITSRITKSITSKMGGNKERARSRSGL